MSGRTIEQALRAAQAHGARLDRFNEQRREVRRHRRAKAPACATCRKRFERQRLDARYCSNRCRQAAHRKRERKRRREERLLPTALGGPLPSGGSTQ